MPPARINLKKRLGRRYKVVYEESYYAQYGPNAYILDPDYMVIPCRHGHIYPASGDILAASVDGHPGVAQRLRLLECCRVHQDGDDGELTVLFRIADFDQVAQIVHPKRRWGVTEVQRQHLREIGFKKGQHSHAGVQNTARTGDAELRDGIKYPRLFQGPI